MTLSPSMAFLALYPRWINWRLDPDPVRPDKPKKIPVNPRNGWKCDPTDMFTHCSYEDARAAASQRGHGVGFVFMQGDNLWFLDLDGCKQPDGQWTPLAMSLVNAFEGHAACEVSQSGNGLHLFGWASQIPDHGCKNVQQRMELYHHARFVALTDNGATGAIDGDTSAQLAGVINSFFPKTSANSDFVDWTDTGVAESPFGATPDDDELLAIMLRSGQNTAGAFFNPNHVPFAALWLASDEVLGKKWPDVTGGQGRSYDASHADGALAAHLAYWCAKDCARIERFMRMSRLARDKWDDREDYLPMTIINACATVTNVAKPRDGQIVQPLANDDARRTKQRELTAQIGEGADIVPATIVYTVEEMLERFVFITDGSQVADHLRPQVVLPWADFKHATAGSKHSIVRPDGSLKTVACAAIWLSHPQRKDAETLTFRAGASVMTVSPAHGKSALNLWSAPARNTAPLDWAERSALFVSHIQWLWGEDADAFLDWLAHIEQKPGELPHFGWVHISRIHGKGRNWISAVLARLWRGNVAASFDLIGALEGGFNDRLSRCVLVIVDEINEGGNNSWRHSQTLRQMVTAEHREINPKYGRRHVEYNAARWLLFSNHTAAIPLGVDDRRFWVVDHDGTVKSPLYYKGLYAALDDPLFLASIAQFLAARNISTFEPGRRPPLTKAKVALVDLSLSENEATLAELVKNWPVDVVTWGELQQVLPDGPASYSVLKHPLDRAGMKKIRKVRTAQKPESVYSLRNHEGWATAAPAQINAELKRLEGDKKMAFLYSDDR